MQRTFNLWGDFGQRETHTFEVSSSQLAAFENAWDIRATAAAIIRANWKAIYDTFAAYKYPCYTQEELWHQNERIGMIKDPKTEREFVFVVSRYGPRFSHEILPAGSWPHFPAKS